MTHKTFRFSFSELAVTWEDLLEQAPEQSKGLDDFPDAMEEVLSMANSLIQAKGGYHIFPLDACEADSLSINGIRFETGKIITKPLRKAEYIALFACTAGAGVQLACSEFTTKGESVKAYIMDTVGTVVVEKAMDRIAKELDKEAANSGWGTTNRYSPGYCGWHVGEQQKLWSLLPDHFCGITLNEASLMNPIKSISGMIGVGEAVRRTSYACSSCTMKHCLYRKRSTTI